MPRAIHLTLTIDSVLKYLHSNTLYQSGENFFFSAVLPVH